MHLRSGRITGSRIISYEGGGGWELYIRPSEQEEARAMLRGDIPIKIDMEEMYEWLSDSDRDERPSPEDVALARAICIASGVYKVYSGDMISDLKLVYSDVIKSTRFDLYSPLP